jgi:hypothetical protein
MTTQYILGNLVCSDGTNIPLKTDGTDGSTSNEVKTDPSFTVTSQSVGDYAPGRTILQGYVSAKTHIAWAYLLRNGVVESIIPVASRTAGGAGTIGDLPLCRPISLRPGDKIMVYTLA